MSPAETEGYPGNLTALVTYTLMEANEVHIEYTATTDAPTIVNLTNHSYFNLAGKVKIRTTHTKLQSHCVLSQGTVHDHILTLNAETYTPAIDTVLLGTYALWSLPRITKPTFVSFQALWSQLPRLALISGNQQL